jgi:arylsulfatase A-like enzyme
MTDSGEKRPNLLLITCDQWRGDCLSAVGHPTVKTPSTDALAAEGVLFRRHYAGAAPCSPARACLYTGLYQMTNRVCRNGTPLDARHGNIALYARALGYDPTLFGYTDTAPDPRRLSPRDPFLATYEGVLPGFTARQLLPEHQKQWLSWLAARGIDSSAGYPEIHLPVTGAGTVTSAPPIYSSEETPAAFIADEFIRWLSERDEPWFAHVSFLSPHPPFIVPAPYNEMYDPDAGPAFRRASSQRAEAGIHPYVAYELAHQNKSSFLPGHDGIVSEWDERTFRQIRATYYGMISEVDAQLGRVFASIKASGAWDDTIVILTSDHAEMMGDHVMLGKGGFFDGSYHIPLIVRDARRQRAAGRAVEAFTEAVDILPTALELLGGKVPGYLDGRPLTQFLDGGQPANWRDAASWEFDFRSIASGAVQRETGLSPRQSNLAVIRDERFKYVHFGGGLPPVLFDLANDPDETRNIAGDPAYGTARLEMAERLLAWRAEHLDQSLALCEVTEDGVVGEYHALP